MPVDPRQTPPDNGGWLHVGRLLHGLRHVRVWLILRVLVDGHVQVGLLEEGEGQSEALIVDGVYRLPPTELLSAREEAFDFLAAFSCLHSIKLIEVSKHLNK